LLLNMRTTIARVSRAVGLGSGGLNAGVVARLMPQLAPELAPLQREVRLCSALPGCRAGRSRTVSAPSSDGRRQEELIGGLAVGAARGVAVLCSIFVAAPAMADLAVHVNRVALEADGPKSALVESDKAGATGEFTVPAGRQDGPGGTAGRATRPGGVGRLEALLSADFSQLTEPGRYRVRPAWARNAGNPPKSSWPTMRCSKSRPEP